MTGLDKIFYGYPGAIKTETGMGANPARVHRLSGDITLNQSTVNNASYPELKYILGHEAGHFLLNTRSEFEADKFAFQQLAGDFPQSLKGSVLSLSRNLPFDNPEHLERLAAQFMRALRYDYQINGNTSALETYNTLKLRLMDNTMASNTSYHLNDDPFDYGAGKARRQEKKQLRVDKKALKNERYAVKTDKKAAKGVRIEALGEAKVIKANAKATKAEKGEGDGGSWFDKTLKTASDIFGSGSEENSIQTKSDGSLDPTANPKFLGMPKTIGIIVTVALALGILSLVGYFAFIKK